MGVPPQWLLSARKGIPFFATERGTPNARQTSRPSSSSVHLAFPKPKMELRGSGEPVRLSLRPAMLQAPGDHLRYGQVRRAQAEGYCRLRYSTEPRTIRVVGETPTTSSVRDSHHHQQAHRINISSNKCSIVPRKEYLRDAQQDWAN